MRILLIQLRRIGDIIVTTPVIDELRRAYPGARIEFLAESMGEPVLRNYPGLDEILVFDKTDFFQWALEIRRRRYDIVLDFMNNPRSAQLTWASGAKIRAGFRTPLWGLVYNRKIPRPPSPKYAVQSKFDLLRRLGLNPSAVVLPALKISDQDFDGARPWWEKNKLGNFRERVAVLPVHRHEIRQWPPAKFRELIELILKTPERAVLLFGGPGEEIDLNSLSSYFPKNVFVIPPGPLRQAAALLTRCVAAVTNDSGLMHLSVAVGTPTVTIYGPTWPQSWNPRTPPHRWVQAQGLSCVGCNLDECPFGHECMEWVSAQRVYAELEAVLAAFRAAAPT